MCAQLSTYIEGSGAVANTNIHDWAPLDVTLLNNLSPEEFMLPVPLPDNLVLKDN